MSEDNVYKHDLAPCALMSETSGYIQYINHLSKINSASNNLPLHEMRNVHYETHKQIS